MSARAVRAGASLAARWVAALAMLGLATAGMYAARGALDKAHVALVYLLIVLTASAAGGRTLGLSISGLAFLCFDFFFLVPYGTLIIENPLDWLVLLAFLITSVVAAQLLYRANVTAQKATERAIEVDRLAALGAETLNAADADEALRAIAAVIERSVGADECEITGIGRVRPDSLGEWIVERGAAAVELTDGTVHLARDISEPRVAFDELTTNASPETALAIRAVTGRPVRSLALPLHVRDRIVGVLRIASRDELVLTPEQARLLTALAYYAALGAERARLVAVAERAESERRVESMRSALLTAVSHDLRTPLTTIKGTAHEILHGADRRTAEIIESEADRMDALVGDMLDLSRIHAGAVRPAMTVNTIDDLLGAALRRAAGVLRGRRVEVDAPDDELLAGEFDLSQMLRVVVNLLDNAAKYSPLGTPIDICVTRRDERIDIAVMDRGPGIPASERERIFDPFYRPPAVPADVRGHGLGLSIARGLAEAQGGTVRCAPRPGGGAIFALELPGCRTMPHAHADFARSAGAPPNL